MRILFANGTVDWGGEKTWALDTARLLSSLGHDCAMVGRPGDAWMEACVDAGLQSASLAFGPMILWPPALRRFLHIAAAFRPDVIVVNISYDMCAGTFAGWRLGVPVVRHAGLAGDINRDPVERLLHARGFARTVAVGHAMKREMLAEHPWLPADRIDVLHIGKDTKVYRTDRCDDLRRQWGLPADGLLLGVTSQLEEKKGHRYLLDALASLDTALPEVHLAVVGRGSHRDALEQRIRRAGLTGRVHLLGFRRDLPEVLRNFDAFVLPSLSEAFPNSLAEAMATGLPCIATDLSCVPEILEDERNGLLVAAGEVDPLRRAIERLARDAALRDRLGREARRTVEQRFDLERKTDEFLVLLERVVRDGPPPGLRRG